MKNQSVSDFVAATMDAVLNSKEHKSLFATQYTKVAQDLNDARKKKDSDDDSCMADDQDAKKKKDSSDSSSASDMNDARRKKDSEKDSSDSSYADDENDARKKKMCSKCKKSMADCKCDESDADDHNDFDTSGSQVPKDRDHGEYDNHFANDLQSSAAYDVAIDSLLTASAAFDSVGLGRGSALILKLASFAVEAKKKDKASKKSKKDSKDSKKTDSQSAKDKKSTSKKDSKDSKDSKKSSKSSK